MSLKHLVVGGTGTLGSELIRQLLDTPGNHVVCFSRCERKQKELAKSIDKAGLSFILGDVRDPASLDRAMEGVHTVFHVAALKHVDTGQREAEEFTKTNLMGTFNVAHAARKNCAKFVVFSSTDKAVDPINLYGATKLAAEIFLYSQNERTGPRFSVFRWGNVLGSNGSVIPEFIDQLQRTYTYQITHEDMTRFWIPIRTAVAFMRSKYPNAPIHAAMIPPIKAAKVSRVAEMIADILEIRITKPKVVGLRPGEKIHEVLSSAHTPLKCISSSDPDLQMSDEELRSYLLEYMKGLS